MASSTPLEDRFKYMERMLKAADINYDNGAMNLFRMLFFSGCKAFYDALADENAVAAFIEAEEFFKKYPPSMTK